MAQEAFQIPMANEEPTREQFISKVYALFCASLLTGGIGAGAGILLGMTYRHYWLWTAIELSVLLFTIIVRRTPGINFVALFTFTGISGLTLSPLLNYAIKSGAGDLIAVAFGVTAVIFGALSLFVHLTKADFRFLGTFLSWAALIFLIVLVWCVFVPAYWNTYALCGFGVFLFSGFVLYDTSRIVLSYALDEYVLATLDLYLDFLNMFVDVLRILLEIAPEGMFDIFSAIDV